MIQEMDLMEIFYWFHRHPELSYEEYDTTAQIKKLLKAADVKILPIPMETGLIAEVKGEKDGPLQALRCDIDALPITELTDLPYASKCPGKMHACGHDFHITAGIGTAIWLQEHKDELCGTVRFFFQPGEESSLGAWKVLETTALDSVTRVWGFHSDPTNLVNAIGIREGAVAAAVDRFVITITGVGCHGAHPDDGVDPIPAAVAMVQAFQTIVTRNINPFHPALISVTRLEAGNTWNVIPQTAHVETVVLLSKGEIDSKKVRVEFSLEDMDMSGFQKGATYEQIKAYVLEHTGLKVSSLYISQIKRKCGLDVGQNYNLSKKEDAKVPKCPPEKEAAIRDALKYFQMI